MRADAEAGHAIFGTTDSWLIWWLTGGPDGGLHLTDVTNASRTMLMDLETLEWDDELLALFDIPRSMLPQIRSSSEVYGHTLADGPFGGEVAIAGDLGDQHAALVGQVCFEPGELKNTYGTGNFLVLNTGTEIVRSANGLLTTLAYKLGDAPAVYALEGSIAVTGSAIQWLRDQLGIIKAAAETEGLAASVEDNGGVYFVPAFSGLFAPYWRSDARGVIVGLSRYNTVAHIARAALEAICYQSKDVVDAMVADADLDLQMLRVDGGVTANELCMQIQADVLGVPVSRPGRGRDHRARCGVRRRARGRLLGDHRRAGRQLERVEALGAGLDRRAARRRPRPVEEGRRAHARLGRRRLTLPEPSSSPSSRRAA